jgi:hypothetical protein
VRQRSQLLGERNQELPLGGHCGERWILVPFWCTTYRVTSFNTVDLAIMPADVWEHSEVATGTREPV